MAAKGYVIVTEDIHDPDGMLEYQKASTPSIIEFGGRPVVVDDDLQVLEGSWHGSRTVVVEFDSVEQARAWYESPSYQAALPLRLAAADCTAVLAKGFTMSERRPR
jgi:uncharacterized protein (DUF1330 family)